MKPARILATLLLASWCAACAHRPPVSPLGNPAAPLKTTVTVVKVRPEPAPAPLPEPAPSAVHPTPSPVRGVEKPGVVKPAEQKTASLPPDLQHLEPARKEAFLTRARLAEFLAAMPGEALETRAPPIMSDILDHAARETILYCVGADLLDEFANHSFRPAAVVSRAELADALWRLASRRGLRPVGEVNIDDLPPTNRYAVPVRAAVALGLMPTMEGAFHPTQSMGGEEAWQVFLRLHRLLAARRG